MGRARPMFAGNRPAPTVLVALTTALYLRFKRLFRRKPKDA